MNNKFDHEFLGFGYLSMQVFSIDECNGMHEVSDGQVEAVHPPVVTMRTQFGDYPELSVTEYCLN